jgi:hypothetical protein
MFTSARVSTPAAFVIACMAVVALGSARPAAAQSEAALKSFFEGKRVTLRMDMPGSSDGVDVRADASRAIDFKGYSNDLKRYGAAIRAGDSVTVTLVKMKKDLIEFQLAGGGFGTFSDDTSTSANIPLVEKTSREKDLEKRVTDEDDRDRRNRLQDELDEVRDRRERENRRIRAERERIEEIKKERIEEIKKERIAEQRLRSGSRFNLRYKGALPPGLRPEDVAAALSEYIDFGGGGPRTGVREDATPSGDISLLRKGMTRADAVRAFGKAVESTERRDGGLAITTLVFDVGDQRVAADFVEDVLVKYTITSKERIIATRLRGRTRPSSTGAASEAAS